MNTGQSRVRPGIIPLLLWVIAGSILGVESSLKNNPGRGHLDCHMTRVARYPGCWISVPGLFFGGPVHTEAQPGNNLDYFSGVKGILVRRPRKIAWSLCLVNIEALRPASCYCRDPAGARNTSLLGFLRLEGRGHYDAGSATLQSLAA